MSVMGIKQSTKAYGETSPAPKSKAGGPSGSPTEYTPDELKKLGGEDVGEVLNKISNPSWVDPEKKLRTVGNDKLDKDSFFKLMLAQMKNQDPTNPLKSHEMAAQLANFSSLEQMQNMNKTLEELKNGQKPLEQYQAVSFIGKSVAGDSAKIVRSKGDHDHDLRFTIPSMAKEVEVQVKNGAGEVLKNFSLKGVKPGETRVTWNGEDEKGTKLPAGDYNFSVEAIGSNGQKMAVKTDFEGLITGIQTTPEGPVLMVGNQAIRMRDVRKVTDPLLMKNDQKLADSKTPDLLGAASIPQTEVSRDEGAPEASRTTDDLMNSVGHSPGMISKLNQETKN
jgi:flagellar basal-body rod modification protein FlgD